MTKKYNVFAIRRRDFIQYDEDDKIQLNTNLVEEKDLERAISFYLARGEWLDRGYYVTEELVTKQCKE